MPAQKPCIAPLLVLAGLAAGCAQVEDDTDRDAPFDSLFPESWGDGNEMIIEQKEQCNNKDDDGNGKVDDGAGKDGELIKPCSTECGEGVESCFGGEWWPCDAPKVRGDGKCPCTDGQEKQCETRCGVGTQTCTDNTWSACSAGSGTEELCDNNIDDDCDGQIDEGECGCEDGSTKPCGDTVGACVAGTQRCIRGEWGECLGYKGPTTEKCNAKDDDCDGTTDNKIDGDRYEENDTCEWRLTLPNSEEGGAENAFQGTIVPDGDDDWFLIRTVESSHFCFPGTGQDFELSARITVVSGTLPQMCLHEGGCSGSPRCTSSGGGSISVGYGGTCGWDDSKEFALKVYLPAGQSNCQEYTVRYSFDAD